jgi:hypothetical protein
LEPFRIKAFYLIGTILVTPESVGILTIIVIVIPWIHNESDFAVTGRTFCMKGCRFEIGNIFHHQSLHSFTGASIFVPKVMRFPHRCPRLVIALLTGFILTLALEELIRIYYILTKRIAIMNDL